MWTCNFKHGTRPEKASQLEKATQKERQKRLDNGQILSAQPAIFDGAGFPPSKFASVVTGPVHYVWVFVMVDVFLRFQGRSEAARQSAEVLRRSATP
jgi:hypothetical protein